MCKNKLSEEKYNELKCFIDGVAGIEGSLISVLHKAQEIFGYLPQEVQLFIARKMNIPSSKVNGVVTFYSYFTEKPKGEHVISVCLGTACFVRGAGDILTELQSILGIKSGETTPDNKFTLDSLRCVGACGLAPIILIDGKVYGRVTKSQIPEILKPYRKMD